MLSVKLVVVGGEAKTNELNLSLPTIIGRGREGVSLTLPHPLVSRKHTELFEEDGKLFVKDLGSLNGTFVNNRRIEGRTPLAPDELLTLGNVTFRAVYDLSGVRHSADESPAVVDVLDDIEVESNASDTNKSIVVDEIQEEVEVSVSKPPVVKPLVQPASGSSKPGPIVNVKVDKPPLNDANPKSAVPFLGVASGGEKDATAAVADLLPGKSKEQVDFNFQLKGSNAPEAVEKVEISLDETVSASAAADSKLGSFLKKMPR